MPQPTPTAFRPLLACIGLALAQMVLAPTALAQVATAPVAQATKPHEFAWSLDALQAAADYSAQHSGRAILVMRDGQVLFEQYNNWTATRPHPLASGTKSFTGVMAMMAIQDGLLSLDERASDTLTEWQSDPKKSTITIRQLLTLSSGLDPADKLLGGRGGGRLLGEGARKRADRLGADPKPSNHFETVLAVPSKRESGAAFEYGPSHFYAFGALLERKLENANLPQKTTLDYLQQRVFKDLNIENAFIGKDEEGCPNLPGGALLPAREWAKFGQFVLDQGSVRQADATMVEKLNPKLLAQCFVPSDKNPSYGLTWWLNVNAESTLVDAMIADGLNDPANDDANKDASETDANNARAKMRERIRERLKAAKQEREADQLSAMGGEPIRVYMAAGLGKQRLYVLPDHNLVIVRFAEATEAGRAFSDAEFLGLALSRIPAKAGEK